jgi:hypothetical protein
VAGVTVLTRNAAGKIESVRLMHRPLSMVLAFSAELARRLQGKLDPELLNHQTWFHSLATIGADLQPFLAKSLEAVWTQVVETVLAELGDTHIWSPQLRLHDFRVQFAQPRSRFAFYLDGIGAG